MIPVHGLQANGMSVERALSLGSWSPFASQWEALSTVCAWSADPHEYYHITASSLAMVGQFALTSDTDEVVSYKVFWRSHQRIVEWEQLKFETPSVVVYKYASSSQCIRGPRAELRIELDKADIDAAMPGLYSDTLLLTLSAL